MSKKIVGYNALVYLKSGGVVSVMVSLRHQDVFANHTTTGNFSCQDLETGQLVSVHKDSLEFLKFIPIYEQDSIGQGEGEKTSAANSEEVAGDIPLTD